jgi:transposase
VSISEQGWAAIQAYEHAGRAAYRANEKANNLLFRTMIIHLNECHGMGEKKIAEMLGVKRLFVREFLKERKEKSCERN